MTGKVIEFVYSGVAVERLDKVLVTHLPDASRSRLQALIKDGRVSVEERPAEKSSQMIEPGQRIRLEIPPPEPVELQPEAIPLDVIFENSDVLVVNKQAGMVVHPSTGHSSGTLVHAVMAHSPDLPGISGEQRPGIVHRLDKDTSGLILIAKNDFSQHWLQDQFRLRKVQKIYLALVDGKPPTPEGRIEAAIARDPSHRKRMAIVPLDKGRESITEYRTRETFPRHTLLEAQPLTGRNHQIRLHLAFIGVPVVGDTVYGRRKPSLPITHHFLHAASLTIRLPGEATMRTFEAPLPSELQAVLNDLRISESIARKE